MMVENLPLFHWRPECQVLIFPLRHRTSKVRRTAALLYSKHGEDAELYWKQVIAANRKHLDRFGLSGEQVHQQLQAFSSAVQSELVRISLTVQNRGGA